jgi:hypothetical protein
MTIRKAVSRTIISEGNTLHIIPAPEEIFKRLQVWPKGVLKVEHAGEEKYLFVLEDKEGEVVGLRFHFGWYSERDNAEKVLSICRLLLPSTLALCANYNFKGIFLPCPYISSPEEQSHVGYVLFIHSLEKFEGAAGLKSIPLWEQTFGDGACSLIETFLKMNYDVWKSVGLPERSIADMEIAYRSQCGAIATDYLMVDSRVICIKQELDEDNPLLIQAAEAGFKEMYWLPLLPTTVSDSRGQE